MTQDLAGNNNLAATPLVVIIDTVPPVPVFSGPTGPRTTATFSVSVDFGEEVSGFSYQIDNGVVTTVTDNNDGSFTFQITASGDGTVVLDVPSGAALDLVGNSNVVGGQFSVVVDTLPPTVALSNTLASLPEDADTTSAVKVADIIVSPDAPGTNSLSLSGPDATRFEIVGTELLLKAATTLDFETQPTLQVTVDVDDPLFAGSPDDSATLNISITDATDANDTPVLGGVPASATIDENVPYKFTATATDSDVPAQTLTFSLLNAPAGASIEATTGEFTWTPDESQAGKTFNFTVRLSDGVADTDQAISLTVSEPPARSLGASLAANQSFTIVGATGSPNTVLSVKIFDGSGNLVSTVQPFSYLSSLRVAASDFDGDGRLDEFAVLGRRTGIDFRAEIVIYDLDATGNATEADRFFAFAPGIIGNGFIATGDFDGDGDDDIAVSLIDIDGLVKLQLHVSNGGTFATGGASSIDFGVVSAPRIGAGDTDGDGFDEFVMAVRSPNGARVLVFDGDTGTPAQQGAGFTWTFGIDSYARGAFVTVGEFDPTSTGEEIILGSNVGGGERVDIVRFDGDSTATLVENGRITPFGNAYNAAVRVAVGQLADRNVIVAGQDRFQAGQYTIMAREMNNPAANPPFEMIPPVTAMTDADGLAPANPSGNRTLGPFVAFANVAILNGATSLLAPNVPGADLLDGDPDDIDFVLAVFDESAQPTIEEIDLLFSTVGN